MDGRDFRFPAVYYVRVYNDCLLYRRYRVNGYSTEAPNIVIYTIHKLSTKLVIQSGDNHINVTFIGKHKGTFKVPLTTDLGEIIKVGISSATDKPVTIESRVSGTLF